MFCYFKGKGGKNRRRGKNENETEKRELIFKEDGQEYAQVTKMLGNGRLEAMCFDGVKRLCHIRGKLRKKVSYRKKILLILKNIFKIFLSQIRKNILEIYFAKYLLKLIQSILNTIFFSRFG